MTRDFSNAMARRTDKELIEIVTTKRNEYQSDAISAAQIEIDKRNLEVKNYATTGDIKIADIKNTPKSEIGLNKLNKFLTFIVPIVALRLWSFICQDILDNYMITGFGVPLVIWAQVSIYRKLKSSGHLPQANDFKSWTLKSWLFFVVLVLIMFLFIYKHRQT